MGQIKGDMGPPWLPSKMCPTKIMAIPNLWHLIGLKPKVWQAKSSSQTLPRFWQPIKWYVKILPRFWQPNLACPNFGLPISTKQAPMMPLETCHGKPKRESFYQIILPPFPIIRWFRFFRYNNFCYALRYTLCQIHSKSNCIYKSQTILKFRTDGVEIPRILQMTNDQWKAKSIDGQVERLQIQEIPRPSDSGSSGREAALFFNNQDLQLRALEENQLVPLAG